MQRNSNIAMTGKTNFHYSSYMMLVKDILAPKVQVWHYMETTCSYSYSVKVI